jgi:hypothetical protein
MVSILAESSSTNIHNLNGRDRAAEYFGEVCLLYYQLPNSSNIALAVPRCENHAIQNVSAR